MIASFSNFNTACTVVLFAATAMHRLCRRQRCRTRSGTARRHAWLSHSYWRYSDVSSSLLRQCIACPRRAIKVQHPSRLRRNAPHNAPTPLPPCIGSARYRSLTRRGHTLSRNILLPRAWRYCVMYCDASDCRVQEGVRWGNGSRRSWSQSWSGGKGLKAVVGGIPAPVPGAGREVDGASLALGKCKSSMPSPATT